MILRKLFLLCVITRASFAGYGAGYQHGYSVPEDQSPVVDTPRYVPSYQKYTRQPSGQGGSYYRPPYAGMKTGGVKTGGVKTSRHYGTKTAPSVCPIPEVMNAQTQCKTTANSYDCEITCASGYQFPFENTSRRVGCSAGTVDLQEPAYPLSQPCEPICLPPCRNQGICTSPDQCYCQPGFAGRQCQYDNRACVNYPALPVNSKRNCSSDTCTISCLTGHEFPDGSTLTNMFCRDGQWLPSRQDWPSVPDCRATCEPPCLNGGVCMALNTCQCARDFRGPQCQYSIDSCNHERLGFNGNMKCQGDMETKTCWISCPYPGVFTAPPAPQYTCLYSQGSFEPQPMPMCDYGQNVIVKQLNPTTPSMITPQVYIPSLHMNDVDSPNIDMRGIPQLKAASPQDTVSVVTPSPGVCFTWGGAHYKTFDGEVYSFRSPCRHILVRDAEQQLFTVMVEHGGCARASVESCASQIHIFLQDKDYCIWKDEGGSIKLTTPKGEVTVPTRLPGISVRLQANDVIIELDAVGAAIKWDTHQLVQVSATEPMWNRTEGLCGVLDGRADTDLIVQHRRRPETVAALAEYWRANKVGEICDEVPSTQDACHNKSKNIADAASKFCRKLLTNKKFHKCSNILDISLLMDACQWDYCSCAPDNEPEMCACGSVSVYAQQCVHSGILELLNWRDQDTCQMKCPSGKVYKACGPQSQPSCALPLSSVYEACVEGCFCPEGLLLQGGKCVEKKECPCKLRNKDFPNGAEIQKDCNTCKCQEGEWKCTEVKCGARCSAIGDPHYTTFDGRRYDFMGKCSYSLLAGNNYTIDAENVACSGAISDAMHLARTSDTRDSPSCTKSVKITYGPVVIRLNQRGVVVVNGNPISALPAHVNDIVIRPVSSLFLVVELPNGVDIFWDTVTRVVVDVPVSFRGQTKGLCGTFNDNQKDDFLTPEGDVEQSAAAFVNKWKTREVCDDVTAGLTPDACLLNVQNKQLAIDKCRILKSELFEDCHWHVDVDAFYEACMYDMCACEHAVGKCLCPVVGAYAMECAAKGVKIQWRSHVKECEILCTGGQTYQVCADSCVRTCSDVSRNLFKPGRGRSTCESKCVEGCACPEGQALQVNGECAPLALCPCHHGGFEFKAGHKEVRNGKDGKVMCTCAVGKWKCRPASPEEILTHPRAADMEEKCRADANLEYTTCEPASPVTCKKMHLPATHKITMCQPGCQCKKGYVLESVSKMCVLPVECPCHHGGQSYPDGHILPEDCNTCECKKGKWQCTQRQCNGICQVWGDSHFTTFDGLSYEFQGVCTYLMAKGVEGDRSFTVEIQNGPCGTTGATCVRAINLKVTGGSRNETVMLTNNNPIPDTAGLERINLYEAGAFVFLDVSAMAVLLQWDRATRLYVKIDPKWKGRVVGLCGNYNDDERDDVSPRGGAPGGSALALVDSHRLSASCLPAQPVRDHCEERPSRKDWAVLTCGALSRDPFVSCHSEVPPEEYVRRCERDACACDSGGDCECVCVALAAYSQLCAAKGVVFKWRSKDLCPCQCDEEIAAYDPCMSACPEETCENTLHYEGVRRGCNENTCIEGCKLKTKCEAGKVFSNSTMSSCIPRAQCSIPCMTLPDGRQVLEGELIEEDGCHQCHCSRRQRVCTGEPCSTPQPTTSPIEPPTTTSLTYIVNASRDVCQPGWSKWINSNVAQTNSVKGQDITTEHEKLPVIEELINAEGLGVCDKVMMKDIQCRTVGEHRSDKDLPLATACSLDRGLICRSVGAEKCPDFEIRVLCECDKDQTSLSQMLPQCLDSAYPNHEHPSDCHKFYQCVPGSGHPHIVEKTCGENMWYNPITMVCDWPKDVELLGPLCTDAVNAHPIPLIQLTEEEINRSINNLTTPRTKPSETTTERRCEAGAVWSACALQCDRLCHALSVELLKHGECVNGQVCSPGCVPIEAAGEKCPAGQLWRDRQRCVDKRSCTCLSNTGNIVKPGGVEQDGCRKCQCLDNAFICDDGDCHSTKIPASKQTLSTPAPLAPTEFTTPVIIVLASVSPPPACSDDRYKTILWAGETPNAVLSASSSISENFSPLSAILNVNKGGGSWTPVESEQAHYVQAAFARREPIYGVITQGSPLFSEAVLTYHALYSDDGNLFSYVDGSDGMRQLFRGSKNPRETVKQMFHQPIEAKYVRIVPVQWLDRIALRFEIIGCQEQDSTSNITTSNPYPTTVGATGITTTNQIELPQCNEPMGFSKGLPFENVQVSSEKDNVRNLDVNQETAWRPTYSTPGEWIYFDFTGPRNITGLYTKGGAGGWVTYYKILYAPELKEGEHFKSWRFITNDDGTDKLFPGNTDSDALVTIVFPKAIRARYLKLFPQTWNKNIEVRVEPIGCYEPYTEIETATPRVIPSPLPLGRLGDCRLCEGVVYDVTECTCSAPTDYFNGEACTVRDKCPCFVGHVAYAVGATFKSASCEDCICKMGGTGHCQPAKCPACPEGEVVKRVGCDCSCAPCAPGERACPSSSVCVRADKWCDGVIDCGDDERDCPTTQLYTSTTPLPAARPHRQCPAAECPPGYRVVRTDTTRRPTYQRFVKNSPSVEDESLLSIPLPPQRKTYTRFQKTKTEHSPRTYAGTKTRFPSTKTLSYALPKPPPAPVTPSDECPKFKCVPPLRPSQDRPAQTCNVPTCPTEYKLHLENSEKGQCPEYICVPPPVVTPPRKDAVCSLTARTINTFDGTDYKYDVCDNLLARDARDDKWTIIIQKNCFVASGCGRELVISQDGDEIRMLPSLQVEYNSRPYTVDQTAKIGMETNAFLLTKNGDALVLVSKKYFFWVIYNVQEDVKIGVTGELLGTVDGLCGYYDGHAENDRRLPNGTQSLSTERFAEAWAKRDLPPGACKTRICPLAVQEKAYKMCNAISEKTLSTCARVLDLAKWRTQCLERVCACMQSGNQSSDESTKKKVESINQTAQKPSNRLGDIGSCLCEALQSFAVECQATDFSMDLQGWRTENNCPAECAPPLVHHDCYRRRCEPACGARGVEHCARAHGVCFPGCFCPEGKLRRGEECVTPHECRDCVCDGKGTPVKYTTFERTDLPFSGNCTYIAARDKSASRDYMLQVYVTNGACARDSTSVCVDALHVVHGSHKLHMQKSNASTQMEVSVDGIPVYQSLKNDWLVLKMHGKDVAILIPDIQLELSTVFANMDFAIRIPSTLYGNRTEGLCGSCAGGDEQVVTQNGTATADLREYGLSWLADKRALSSLDIIVEDSCNEKKQEECLPPPPDQDPCFKILDPEAFGACHPVVDPVPYLATCQQDLCGTGEQLGVCSSLERYASECRRTGICVDWRKKNLCPHPCEGEPKYRACELGCTLTCENFAELSRHPELCGVPTAEGCYCPQGKVLVNNTCVEHTKCFPCDAQLQHYVGDEWQESACKKCSCFKSRSDNKAVVSCIEQECAPHACGPDHVAEPTLKKPSECCQQYICVPLQKKTPLECKKPQRIECSTDQVEHVDIDAKGCKIYLCTCMDRSKCPPLNHTAPLEPGTVRMVDTSGCCPKERLVCNRTECPQAPACPQFHERLVKEVKDKCCPEYECVIPKDKCLVKLEWEGRQEGGEVRRASPQTVIKAAGEVWSDGACRTCRCGADGTGVCTLTACAELLASDSLVIQSYTPPFQCCAQPEYVACKHHDKVFQVGEEVASEDACSSYECVRVRDRLVEKRTKTQQCNTHCKPGSEYRSAQKKSVCCGECHPVACAVEGVVRAVGDTWTSDDLCTMFSCVATEGDVQVRSEVQFCANASEDMLRDYAVKEVATPGECCPMYEPVACKYNGTLYKVGESWPTRDACARERCARDARGRLARVRDVQTCSPCARGFARRPPTERQCCGVCEPTDCVDGDVMRPINSTWLTADNCTTMTCSVSEGQPALSSASESCPNVSKCRPEDVYTKGCCKHCKPQSLDHSTCAPELLTGSAATGVVEFHLAAAGAPCTNRVPLQGFTRCSGGCTSKTLYNKYTGGHDSDCECCRQTRLTSITVELVCPDGHRIPHQIAVPAECSCQKCRG